MELKHSGLGIASCSISVCAGILLFIAFGIAGYLELTTPGGIDEQAPTTVLVGLAIIALFAIELVAICFGIASLLEKNKKRLFAILGLSFSSGSLLIAGGVMALGLAVA